MAALGTAVAAVSALMVGASPIASAQSAAPKAYIGLFGDNAIAVLDTAANKGTKTIPIPTGPHGLVITPDNKMGLREQ
jgi:YVTN family beta-propeller protein